MSIRNDVLALFAVAWLAGCGSSRSRTEPITPPDELRAVLSPTGVEALRKADRLTLFSVFPNPRSLDPGEWTRRGIGAEVIGDYAVLGRVVLEGAERARVLDLVYTGIEDSDGTVAACFNPRHALRAERDGHVVDLVICYECLSLAIWETGRERTSVTTTSRPGRALTALLREKGQPVSDV